MQATAKTVIVTGGSRGLGRAICLAFAEPGVRIYFNYHSADQKAAETEKAIQTAGGTAVSAKVDVTRMEAVQAYFKSVVDDSGRIDILVNNAGITRDGLIAMMKDRDWNDVVDTNLKGTYHCIKAVSRTMVKQRYGRIVNMTSVVGSMGNPGQANYAASKAGIIGLTKSVAKELATRGITVNAVAPGYVETDMTAGLPSKAKDAMLRMIPIGRAAEAEEVAAAVTFLASDQASYITGQVLHVNGGMYC